MDNACHRKQTLKKYNHLQQILLVYTTDIAYIDLRIKINTDTTYNYSILKINTNMTYIDPRLDINTDTIIYMKSLKIINNNQAQKY